MAFNLDDLVSEITEGEDTSSQVTVESGEAATTKSKSGA